MQVIADALSVGSVFGHYRIEAPIGAGGMGTVYRATHLALESTVALKVIRPEAATDPEARQRFVRERKLAAQLNHPHIVRTFDGGEEDAQLFVVMDVIDGHDLQTLIRPDSLGPPSPFDPWLAATIISQIGAGLDEAHRLGMIHRDVKPANILVATRDGGPWAYLTDFGLARLADATTNMAMSFASGTGQLLGTPYYMSPEQTRALKEIGWRTDIWSLGAVLYAMLTGAVPYQRDSWFDLARAIVEEPFPPLTDQMPAAQALNAVLERAMAKRPEDRYQSAAELGRAALDAVASLPASTWPPVAIGGAASATASEREMAARAAALLRTPTREPASPESPQPAQPASNPAVDELAREMAARAAAALLGKAAVPQQEKSAESSNDVEVEAARRAAAALAELARLGRP